MISANRYELTVTQDIRALAVATFVIVKYAVFHTKNMMYKDGRVLLCFFHDDYPY